MERKIFTGFFYNLLYSFSKLTLTLRFLISKVASMENSIKKKTFSCLYIDDFKFH